MASVALQDNVADNIRLANWADSVIRGNTFTASGGSGGGIIANDELEFDIVFSDNAGEHGAPLRDATASPSPLHAAAPGLRASTLRYA